MTERVMAGRATTTGTCPRPAVCDRFDTGHLLHPVHERMLANRPWGWREGTVSEVRAHDDGVEVVVQYPGGEGSCRAWHHAPLDLDAGLRVRVHEQYHALEAGSRRLNVRLIAGVGPVPEPLHR